MVRFVLPSKLSFRALLPVLPVIPVLTALLAVASVSAPLISAAARDGGSPSAQREEVRAKKAAVASQVDALRATTAEVTAALDALQANVSGQQALLAEAQRAAAEAEKAFADATAAVDAKTKEIDGLRGEIREFAVAAFVHPPSDDALAALDSDNPGEAAQKRTLLEIQNTSDTDLLDQLKAAEEDLQVRRQMAEDAANLAAKKKSAAADRLSSLTDARDQQAAYVSQVEARLDQQLGEAAALETLDASLSAQIRADQAAAAELARKAAAANVRPPSSGGGGNSTVGTVSPSLSSVSCPGGGSITVANSIAGSLQSMLNAASSAGVTLCGGGYRSSAGQIATRMANCGTSYYAIYEMPPSQCSPPTARPGTSMHEQGLAIDFTCNGGGVITSHSSPCFVWLDANAGSYGLANLPSEPWHWSSNGN